MSDINPCISEDIWFEIFKELPVKTLGKCRCVCKSWHSLIVSPSFITAHFKHYTQNDTNTLLLYREMSTKIPQHEQYRFFLDSGRIPLQQSHTSICPFKVHDPFIYCSFFVGSIHGLLCLSDNRYLNPTSQIMLWNPFLRKMINLPTSTATISDLSDITSVLGFAYDSNKNDHRVVKISFSRGNHGFNPLVEVYSVWDRIWKTICADYLADNMIRTVSCSQCFLNGAIHWLTWENGVNSIISKWVLLFDVVDETFQKIELPEDIVTIGSGEFGVFEYKSNLSVSHCGYNYLTDIATFATFRIWVKEDESWCMILYVVLANIMHIGPIDYVGRNDEIFGFAEESGENLMLYDLITRQFTDDELGLGLQQGSTKFAVFTESLVLLDKNTDVYTDDDLQRSVKNRHRSIFIDYSSFDFGDPLPELEDE